MVCVREREGASRGVSPLILCVCVSILSLAHTTHPTVRKEKGAFSWVRRGQFVCSLRSVGWGGEGERERADEVDPSLSVSVGLLFPWYVCVCVWRRGKGERTRWFVGERERAKQERRGRDKTESKKAMEGACHQDEERRKKGHLKGGAW